MDYPSIEEIRAHRERLGELVRTTPVWQWQAEDLAQIVGEETVVFLKLELFQFTGSFKPRGALTVMLDMDPADRANGVTAVSAGNHAIAVAFAAGLLQTTAKVVMPKTANAFRVARCESYGAEVVLVDSVQEAFARVQQIQEEEGRLFVHPFEGPLTALGTATAGFEFCTQVPDLDAIIIPIGGGGLCGGMACAIKQLRPACQVIGVEPEGANSMYLSFQAGAPQSIDAVRTIADSLGAPYALPYSYQLCRNFVDDLVLIDDNAMRQAMGLLFRNMKLAVEPAGAAATAALCGPLRERLRGKRVGLIVCGANIDLATFASQALV
ncbi:MAG: threonine/serine dehydratase [Caldilineaceae bacterium]|nr:threonine/serine dehydratase [Caldilineaceae bacterium]